jgi:hypothetical protein
MYTSEIHQKSLSRYYPQTRKPRNIKRTPKHTKNKNKKQQKQTQTHTKNKNKTQTNNNKNNN